jgi:hypothetical protein
MAGLGISVVQTARDALADYLETVVGRLRTDVYDAGRAVAAVRNHLRIAQNQMIFAELELASVEETYGQVPRNGNTIGNAVDLGTLSVYVLSEAVFQNAERLVGSIQTRLTKCLAEEARVDVAFRNAISNCDPLVRAVIAEEYELALERLANARAEYVAAQIEAIALSRACSEHARSLLHSDLQRIPWFRAGERAKATLNRQLSAEVSTAEVNATVARWQTALGRLSSDATARG